MSIAERFHKLISTYFTLVALISAAIFILGIIFDPNASLGYSDLKAPFIYAALGIVPYIIISSDKELTAKQYIIRKILQLAIVEAEIIPLCLTSSMIKNDTLIYICLSIMVVFVIASAIDALNGWITAKKLTSDLIAFQQSADN